VSTNRIRLTVNDRDVHLDVSDSELLIDFLRGRCGLTGTKLGCGTGDCGACTVLLGGQPVNACLVYAAECDEGEVETVEGVADAADGEVVIGELHRADATQCGFCTPGIVVTATALLRGQPCPTGDELTAALAGNLCRCTGYAPILRGVRAAADRLAGRGA
jgi:carbon-monoxide dehydrogenase small subunit